MQPGRFSYLSHHVEVPIFLRQFIVHIIKTEGRIISLPGGIEVVGAGLEGGQHHGVDDIIHGAGSL